MYFIYSLFYIFNVLKSIWAVWIWACNNVKKKKKRGKDEKRERGCGSCTLQWLLLAACREQSTQKCGSEGISEVQQLQVEHTEHFPVLCPVCVSFWIRSFCLVTTQNHPWWEDKEVDLLYKQRYLYSQRDVLVQKLLNQNRTRSHSVVLCHWNFHK